MQSLPVPDNIAAIPGKVLDLERQVYDTLGNLFTVERGEIEGDTVFTLVREGVGVVLELSGDALSNLAYHIDCVQNNPGGWDVVI